MAEDKPRFVELLEVEVDSPEFARLKPSLFKAYMYFRRWVDWYTGEVSAPDSKVAKCLGMRSKRGARRIIKALLRLKLLELNKYKDKDGMEVGGRGDGRRFSDYKVRDLRGEFLFTPGVTRNAPLGGQKKPPGGNENDPNTNISISPLLNSDIREGKESIDRAGPKDSLPNGDSELATAKIPRVLEIIKSQGVTGRAIQEIGERVSLEDALNALDSTIRARKKGKFNGPNGKKEKTSYFIGTVNKIYWERMGVKTGKGQKEGSTGDSRPLKSAEELSANQLQAGGDDSEVRRAAKRPANGNPERHFVPQSDEIRETRELEALNAVVLRKRAMSARRLDAAKPLKRSFQ